MPLPPSAPLPALIPLPPSVPPLSLFALLPSSTPPALPAAASLQPAYNLMKDKDRSELEELLNSGPVGPEDKPSIFPPDDNLKGMGKINSSTKYYGALEKCRKEAILQGDADTIQAFPVMYHPNQLPQWESLPYEAVKELRKSVRDYGVQSSFTYNLYVAIGDSYVMTLHDWKILLQMILSPMQFAVFMTGYQEQATNQAMNNFNNLNHIGMEELMGERVQATPQAQAQMDRRCFEQVNTLVLRAICQIPDTTLPNSSFTAIKQETAEPYIKFLDCLQKTLERQVENQTTRDVLFKQLTIENTNADCRKVLQSLKNADPSITDMIKACQDIDIESHKMDLLVDTLAARLNARSAERMKCYNCGEPSHVQRDCKKPK
uniref:Gag polyprotein n=1 Tax=Meleagris gallopavo TaxID=9103 RepID=A0A803YBC5_MELGA